MLAVYRIIKPSAYFIDKDDESGGLYLTEVSHNTTFRVNEIKELIEGLQKFLDYYSEEEINEVREQQEIGLAKMMRPSEDKNPQKKQKPQPVAEAGYVYFLQEKRDGLVKIGKSKNLSSRTRKLSVEMPFETELIHTVKTADACNEEIHYHKMFRKKRVKGEWFNLTEKDIKAIKKSKPAYPPDFQKTKQVL